MQNIKSLILIIALYCSFSAEGQLVNSMYFMDNLPQASKLNPARMPNCNAYVNIANINMRLFTGVGPQHILNADNVINDTLRMPYYNETLWNNLLSDLDDPMPVMLEEEVGLGFGFRHKQGYFHFDLSNRTMAGISLAKDFLYLNDLSNGAMKDFSTMNLNASSFMQLGLGYAYELNSKLSLGVKLKVLRGLGNIDLVVNKGELTTSVESWRFVGDADANMAFPVDVLVDEDGNVDDFDTERLENLDKNYFTGSFFTNMGLAFDVGAEYKLLPNLYLSASLVDFGKIWWNKDVSNINATADVEYDGITDEPVFYDSDEFEDYLSDFADSLLDNSGSSLAHNSYSTSLAPKLYIGAEYLLNDVYSFGILSNTTFYNKQTMQSIMFSANANMYHFLTAGVHYGWNWNYANTAGFTVGFNVWPLQVFLAADYLPLRYQNVDTGESIDLGFKELDYIPTPVDFNALSVQLGVNLKFGCRKKSNVPIFERGYNDRMPAVRNL